VTGCATASPEQAARRELLSNAAQECQRRYPFVSSFSFDRFDQLNWFYRETATVAEREQFRTCYRERVTELTKAAAAAPASSAPGRPAAGAMAPVPADAWTHPPIWKIGDEWSYRWESPRGSGTFVRKVSSEEAIDGIECYVVSSGRYSLYFRKTDLAWVMQRDGWSITLKYTPPRQEVAWPLHVDRTWEQLYVQEEPERRVTGNYLRLSRVEARERITVPAGTFDALKVVVRNKYSNAVVRQYWVSLDVKNVVLRHEYYDYGTEKQELTAFQLN
jgi:hypothetical protein